MQGNALHSARPDTAAMPCTLNVITFSAQDKQTGAGVRLPWVTGWHRARIGTVTVR